MLSFLLAYLINNEGSKSVRVHMLNLTLALIYNQMNQVESFAHQIRKFANKEAPISHKSGSRF